MPCPSHPPWLDQSRNTVILFMVYLMTFSIAQFIKRRIIGWFVSSSLESTWMEAVAGGTEENKCWVAIVLFSANGLSNSPSLISSECRWSVFCTSLGSSVSVVTTIQGYLSAKFEIFKAMTMKVMSYGMWRRVVWQISTNISEEPAFTASSNFKTEPTQRHLLPW
jgi:hypothetical protein